MPKKSKMANEWVVVVTDGFDDPGVEGGDVTRVPLSCGMCDFKHEEEEGKEISDHPYQE